MNNESSSKPISPGAIFRNWLSLSGLVIVFAGLFAFVLLFTLDAVARISNPYVGILTYFGAPGVTAFGLALTILGALIRRRRLARANGLAPTLAIDLARPRDRKVLGYFLASSTIFLLITAMGTYHAYHFTESVPFCGQSCHTVMEPEMVAYQNGRIGRSSPATWCIE